MNYLPFDKILHTACSRATLERMDRIWSKMEPGHIQPAYPTNDFGELAESGYCCVNQILAAIAELGAGHYLEIGTRRGHSLAIVACTSPTMELYSFDLWEGDYGNQPNPGPEFVTSELAKAGYKGDHCVYFKGNSRETIPKFFATANHRQRFDMIYVDGDHDEDGAQIDLDNVVGHIAENGFVIFDDLGGHMPHLNKVWKSFTEAHPELESMTETRFGTGWGLARRLV